MKTFHQQLVLLKPLWSVLLRTPGLTECPARPPFADAQFTPDVRNAVAALTGR
jgi:hypothetical protein